MGPIFHRLLKDKEMESSVLELSLIANICHQYAMYILPNVLFKLPWDTESGILC